MKPLIQSKAARLIALCLLATVSLACGSATGSPTPIDTTLATPSASASASASATLLTTPTATASASPTHLVTPTPKITAKPKTGYVLIDLGAIDSGPETILFGINTSRMVVGSNFRYHAGTKTTLKPAPGQTTAGAVSINTAGTMTGTGCGTNCHATKWTAPATGKDLGTLGGDSSTAYKISDSGVVVGFSDTTGNVTTHAFRQSGVAAMVDLNSVVVSGPTLKLREAWGINSSGTIVGWAGDNGAPHAFRLTSAGTLSEIGPLPGMDTGEARAINNHGHVTGFGGDGVHVVGFLYNGTTLKTLPTLSGYQMMHPYGINESDVIVGCGRNATDDSKVHAFRYSGGKVVDLNTFLPGGSGWVLECATGISNDGAIVGTGRKGSHYHAFMLVPA